MRIGVVGVCGAGKSVLVGRLNQAGYDAHEIAQEHSYVPDMWRRIHPPDVLVFLEGQYETIMRRRPNPLMTPRLYGQMQERLRHAREHADITVVTDDIGEEEVFGQVVARLHPPTGCQPPE
jgi:GTPase SAR1 family protein